MKDDKPIRLEDAKVKKWAVEFKEHHNCFTCPFVKNEVDVGVGIIRDCDIVCHWGVEQIISEMEGYAATGSEV
jgi:hypothetical protein